MSAFPQSSHDDLNIHIDDTHLPTTFRTDRHTLSTPSSDLKAFLESDLSVDRINRTESYLWLTGLPYPPRTLSAQHVLGRSVIATHETSLHLVWTTKKIFIKPLPRYMVSVDFYDQFLSRTGAYGPALGLLHTYIALVPTELDFEMARGLHLFPPRFEWESWRGLARRVLDEYPNKDIYAYLPPRYRYGELRLSRLDKIYRLRFGEWMHGYSALTGSTRYVDLFLVNTDILAACAVYIVVVLSGMQVALAANEDIPFHRLCQQFSIFSILAPIIFLTAVALTFVSMFLWNLFKTIFIQYETSRSVGNRTNQKAKDIKYTG